MNCEHEISPLELVLIHDALVTAKLTKQERAKHNFANWDEHAFLSGFIVHAFRNGIPKLDLPVGVVRDENNNNRYLAVNLVKWPSESEEMPSAYYSRPFDTPEEAREVFERTHVELHGEGSPYFTRWQS